MAVQVAAGWSGRAVRASSAVEASLPWVGLAVAVGLTGAGLVFAVLNQVSLRDSLGDFYVATTGCALSFAILGGLVTRRRPGLAAGRLFCLVACATALPGFMAQYARFALVTHPGTLPAGRPAAWLADWIWVPGDALLLVGVPLLFPDGRPPARRWGAVGWLAAAGALLTMVGSALAPVTNPDLPEVPNPYGVPWLAAPAGALSGLGTMVLAVAAVGSVWSLVVRYRKGGAVLRYQVRWFALAAAAVVVGGTGVQIGALLLHAQRNPVLLAYLEAGTGPLLAAGIGVAVLRHQLYDIDLWINRTLVWGCTSALIVAGYMLVVAWLGAQLNVHGTGSGLVGAAAVAVAFHPLREQVQRSVNRLLYGWRREPYTALTDLGRRLESAVSADALLATITTTVREALRLPYVCLSVGGVVRSDSGTPGTVALRLPLQVGTETIGELAVASRRPGEPLAGAERRLLADFARQAAVATHAARLTADLQAARQRLVSAREEERRRLRRDLHDGLGPQLASQTLTADAVRAMLRSNPDAADALLVDLRTQIQQAVADIRRIVHDLRPPALDERGLIAALQESATRFATATMQVSVTASQPLPDLPAAVEVAAYRIIGEAMTNAARHSAAARCEVRLRVVDGALRVEVTDDGRGLPAEPPSGVGLASIRERAAELGGSSSIGPAPGGGVRVSASLPLQETP